MQSSRWIALAMLCCAFSSSCASPPDAAAAGSTMMASRSPLADIRGAQRFVFDGWAGPPIPIWYLRPERAPATAPIVFVMHGLKRDADRYLLEWSEITRANGFIVVVPEFSARAFPGALGYNFGGTFTKGGQEVPREHWSYSAIEKIFDALREREQLQAPEYWLFGHSAGAQFVHRFAMLGMGPRMHAAISANAGSYMLATLDVRWPFGVGGAPGGGFDFGRAFASPMILMLGDADNDPHHPSLPHQPEADSQGPHRLARGKNFYVTARRKAERERLEFAWSCVIVPGVGHDNGKMATFAARIIGARSLPKAGGDCAKL